MLLSAAAPLPAAAADAGENDMTWRDAGVLAGGVATAFLAHEAGHVVTNLAFGNVPTLEGFLAFGFVPFFTIRPSITCVDDVCRKRDGSEFGAGRRGKFAIVAAGFNVQQITDEVLLRHDAELRWRHAPFRKGVLLFNVATSFGYALASWAGIEDPRGDIANAASAARVSHNLIAAFVFAPALLDTVRYVWPHLPGVPFAAATSKVVFIGLNFAF